MLEAISQMMESKLEQAIEPIRTDLAGVKSDLAVVKSDLDGVKSDLVGVKSGLEEVKSDLDGVKTDLAGVKSDLDGVKSDLDGVKTDLAGVKSDLEEVKHRVTTIEVTQENDVKTQLRLLGEGQQGMNEKFKKLDQVAEDVEDIKGTVHILEAVTKSNTTQIKELRLVK